MTPDDPRLAPGTGFALALPPDWLEVDVDPRTREGSLQALLEEQVRDVPELRPHRTALARLLRTQVTAAWDAGASLCAGLVLPTEEGPVVAGAVVVLLPAPIAGTDPDALLDALPDALPDAGAALDQETWRSTQVVEVPGAAPGVRAWGVEDVPLPEGAGTVRLVGMHTLVPLSAQSVLLLSCTSPVLPLEDELLDLFEAVSATLEITREEAA